MADALAWIKRFWWVFAIVAVIGATLWIGGLIAAPFVWLGERLCLPGSDCQIGRLRDRLDASESQNDAFAEQTEGREEIARANDAAQVVILETRTITERAVTEAQGAPDAQTPVGPDRDARARSVRERLCLANPGSCPGPAPQD